VKHKKNIYESLETYIEGDQISEYFCENCEKKVNAVKRVCLQELPNILIVHLQRIVFNFDTYLNDKVNSRFEFPEFLNLEAFTKQEIKRREEQNEQEEQEELEKICTEYKLVGVVVHSGTAEAGHYFSYIRASDRWLEFNDSNVKLYNFDHLEQDCFGGSQDTSDD